MNTRAHRRGSQPLVRQLRLMAALAASPVSWIAGPLPAAERANHSIVASASAAGTTAHFRNATIGWYDDTLNASLDDTVVHRLIDHLKLVGYDGITFQLTVDTDAAGNVLDSKPKARMWEMLDYASEIGLGTAIQVNWSAGGNVALDMNDIPPGFSIPTMLQGVRTYFAALAPLAEAHHASTLFLGYHSDNIVTAAYREQWAAIIGDIRAAFSGRISYIGWYGAPNAYFPQIAIWDLVDAIGVELHMDYPTMPLYDVDEIQAGYFHRPNTSQNVVTDLITLSRNQQKPLIFGSLYFMSLDNALDGWDPTPAQAQQTPLPLNPAAQIAGYEAALEVIAKNLGPFVQGINFSLYEPWEYQTFTPGGSFTAADAAVLNAFKYVGALAGPTTDFPGTPAEQYISSYLAKPWGYHTTSTTTGSPGDDVIYTGTGDNTVYSQGGNDEVHGGAGLNTIVFPGSSEAYTVTVAAENITVGDNGQPANVVIADHVSVLRFTDRAIVVHQPGSPVVSTPPVSQAVAASQALELSVTAESADTPAIAWRRDGIEIAEATAASLVIPDMRPGDAGLYVAWLNNSTGNTTSAPAIVGLTSDVKVIGAGEEIGRDIPHPNGNIFDQVLLTGAAEAITADYAQNQITRTSFVDLDDDIVQVEFSGPGTLSLVLDDASGPALPVKYNQTVNYMKGHVGIVITGADERTNVLVFTVGRATAVNQALFKDDVSYGGIADVAYIAIASTNGKFGGLRAADANFFASHGLTGIYAPGVAFQGPVFAGNISAFDAATPALVLGSAADVRITGGDLFQANGRAVEVSGIAQLKFVTGSDSHGNLIAAKANLARLEQDGVDVTDQIVVNPAP